MSWRCGITTGCAVFRKAFTSPPLVVKNKCLASDSYPSYRFWVIATPVLWRTIMDDNRRQDKKQQEKRLIESWDAQYLWHPFTQMKEHTEERPLIITEGNGVMLYDIDGNGYIDGVSSMWCNLLGHRNREIDDSIRGQLDKVAHTTLLGPTSVPAVKLARELVRVAPDGLSKVFYSDNGSTAMEISIKIAFQYWQQRGGEFRSKTKFVAFENGYHGDTIGAISVGGVALFHELYKPLLFDTAFHPSAYCYRCSYGKSADSCDLYCLGKLEEMLKADAHDIAGVVMEPVVQGAGGMLVQPAGYLAKVKELCKRYNVLLILDEVLTGFGRTGELFGCMREGVTPDIMAVAKGINGGYIPLAATLCTDEIYSCFLGRHDEKRTFFHGHTYTGNPLACVAALAVLRIIERDGIIAGMQSRIRLLKEWLDSIAALKHVGDVRQCGLIAGVELVSDKDTKESFEMKKKIGIRVCREARKRGVLIRPLGDVIVVMPPLVIGEDDLNNLMSVVNESIEVVTTYATRSS